MAFLSKAIILFNQNSSQDIFFVHISVTLANSSLALSISATIRNKNVKCRPISEYGQQHVFSIRWQQCQLDVLHQTNPNCTSRFSNLSTFWHYTAARQLQIVFHQQLEPTDPEILNLLTFLVYFDAYFARFAFPRSCRSTHWARRKLEQPFDSPLYQKHSC